MSVEVHSKVLELLRQGDQCSTSKSKSKPKLVARFNSNSKQSQMQAPNIRDKVSPIKMVFNNCNNNKQFGNGYLSKGQSRQTTSKSNFGNATVVQKSKDTCKSVDYDVKMNVE